MPKYRLKPKTVEGFIAPCNMVLDDDSKTEVKKGDLVVDDDVCVYVINADDLLNDYEELSVKGRKKRTSVKTVE